MLERKKYSNCFLPLPKFGHETNIYYSAYFMNGNINIDATTSLVESLSNNMYSELYYSFNIKDKHECHHEEKHDCTCCNHHESLHAHSFEEVVNLLYLYPESFYLTDDDLECYSKQELAFLKRCQNYLLYVGRCDTDQITKELCNNKKAESLLKCGYTILDKNTINNILAGKQKDIIELTDNVDATIKIDCDVAIMDEDYKIYGIIHVKEKNRVSIKEFRNIDVDYKIRGFKSMDEFIKDIKSSDEYHKDIFVEVLDVTEIKKD